MSDAFGNLEPEIVDLDTLVADGSNSGGNSTMARRERVKLQRRDRYGRWAEMGGGVSFKGRRKRKGQPDEILNVVGRYVGPASRDGYLRVLVENDPNGLPSGIYEVNGRAATVAKAIITKEQLSKSGVELDVNGNRIGDVMDKDIENLDTMYAGNPTPQDQDVADNAETPEEKKVIAQIREAAPAHESYNVVDEKGNAVEVKAKIPAKKESAPAKSSKKAEPTLEERLATREANIDRAQLTGQQNQALDNLLKYKERAVTALKTNAINRETENYDKNYAIAQRITDTINEMADNFVAGNVAKTSIFSGSQDARLENLRIIQGSIKTAPITHRNAKPGQRGITNAEGVFISKTGIPYQITWTNGTGVQVFEINKDGSRGTQVASIAMSGQDILGDGYGGHQDTLEPGKLAPMSCGMIRTGDAWQEQGIAGFMIAMGRYVAQESGRPFAHSPRLLRNGNFYSKLVSLHYTMHHRTQRDKAVLERTRDGNKIQPIYQAIKNAGLGGTRFWTKLGPNTQENDGNESPLHNGLNRVILQTAEHYRQRYNQNNNLQPGVDFPEIMAEYVMGGDNPDWSKFDLQTKLLRTVYQGGTTKEEALALIDSINAQMSKEYNQGLSPDTRFLARLTSLRDSIAATEFPDAVRLPEPKLFNEKDVKFWDSPFAGSTQFTGYVVPQGVKPVEVAPTFLARSVPPVGSPADWTENPVELANKFSAQELTSFLRAGIVANQDGSEVNVPFNEGTAKVRGGAIFRALQEQGQDATGILAKIYDEAGGNNDNQTKLDATRAQMRDINSEIDKIRSEFGELAKPIPFDQIQGIYDPANGALYADLKQRDQATANDLSNVQLRPLTANVSRTTISGVELDSNTYSRTTDGTDWLMNGVTDDPRLIAYNFSTDGLKNAITDAIVTGKSRITLKFPNGKEKSVDIRAIRDALQHQGVNTEELFNAMPERFVKKRSSVHLVLNNQNNGQNSIEIAIGGENSPRVFQASFNDARDGQPFLYEGRIIDRNNPNSPSKNLVKVVFDPNSPQGEQYHVWYNREADATNEPFSGEPTAKYATRSMAMAQVSFAAQEDLFTNRRFSHLDNLGGMDIYALGRSNKTLVAPEINDTPTAPNAVKSARYRLGSGLLDSGSNNAIEVTEFNENSATVVSYDNILADANGKLVKKNVVTVDRSTDANGAEVFTVNLEGTPTAKYNNLESAKKHAAYLTAEKLELQNVPSEDLTATSRARDGINVAQADNFQMGDVTSSENGGLKVAKADAVLSNGRLVNITATVNSNNPGRYLRANPNFVYAKVEITDATDGSVVKTVKVYRDGQSVWRVSGTGSRRTKEEALALFMQTAAGNAGIKQENLDALLPQAVQRREPTAPQAPNEPVVPVNPNVELRQTQDLALSPIDRARVQAVLDRMGSPVSLDDPRITTRYVGGGANGSIKFTLPDGRSFKVKTYGRNGVTNVSAQSERANINEAAAHALFDALGVNATPGGIGNRNGRGVVADPWADNIFQENGRKVGWMEIVEGGAYANDPRFDKAREDLRNIYVAGLLVGDSDHFQHPANYFLVTDPDGTIRTAMCDGGGMLLYRAVGATENPNFTEDGIRRIIKSRFGDFMTDGVMGGRVRQHAGMTPDVFKQIVQDRIVPFTPALIEQFVNGMYTNRADREKAIRVLKARRADLLNYLQIQDVQQPQPIQAPAAPTPEPVNAPSVPKAPKASKATPAPVENVNPNGPLMIADGNRRVDTDAGEIVIGAQKYDNGDINFTNSDGQHIGTVRERGDGKFVAVFMPTHIGTEDRNGDALKAIFSNREDANNWLSAQVYEATGANGRPRNLVEPLGNASEYPEARFNEPEQVIAKGNLNPMSEAQKRYATNLLNTKAGITDEERTQMRNMLEQDGITSGEVGTVITKLKNNPDRTSAEIADSMARDHGVDVAPAQPSDLQNPVPAVNPDVAIRDLAVGNKIAQGRVVATNLNADGKYDVVVVDADNRIRILRNLNGDVKTEVLPESAPSRDEETAVDPAVDPAARANEILQDAKNAYPDHVVLPNGDLLIGQREWTTANGEKYRYEAIVHRTGDEKFVGYVRQIELDSEGRIIRVQASAFTKPAHSSLALLNRLPSLFNGNGGPGAGIRGTNPNNWFNNLTGTCGETIDPRTGQLLPVRLINNPNAQFVGNTGIDKTGDGIKDALIMHLANLIDNGTPVKDILAQFANGDGQIHFSKHQLYDLIERIEANRANPGTNAIPYVSKDGKTIVRAGDRVIHYNAQGIPTGKVGVVRSRISAVPYQKVQGRYVYTDILYVQWDGKRSTSKIAARRLEVVARADGSAPLPAVQEPRNIAPSVSLPPAPQAPQAPAAPQGVNVPAPAVNIAVNGKMFNTRKIGDRLKIFTPDGDEAGSLHRRPDGKYVYVNPFSGENTVYDNYAQALAEVTKTLKEYDNAGMFDGSSSKKESAPQVPAPQAPVNLEKPQAPAAPANENANAPELPVGYQENVVRNGRTIEIVPDPNEPDAPAAPHATLNKVNGEWVAEYWTNGEKYNAGADPFETKNFATQEEARNYVVTKMNDYFAEQFAKQNAPQGLPEGFVNEPINSDGTAFEIKHNTDGDNKPYILIEQGADGKWNAMQWNTGAGAVANRYRRPDTATDFATKEEAEAWANEQLNPAKSKTSGKTPEKDFADVQLTAADKAVLAGYPSKELSERMAQVLELKRQFQQGYTVEAVVSNGGGGTTKRIKLADGTIAYLKTPPSRDASVDIKNELAGARMMEALGLNNLVIGEVIDGQGKRAVLSKEVASTRSGSEFLKAEDGVRNIHEDGARILKPNSKAFDLQNAREMALADFLMGNSDRHWGNWLVNGNAVVPIDHGFTHGKDGASRGFPVEAFAGENGVEELKNDKYGRFNSGFLTLMREWAKGNRPGLFTSSEIEAIRQQVLALRPMYEQMGGDMLNFFDNGIMKRLETAKKIASNQ